jgi:hypothetical protein
MHRKILSSITNASAIRRMIEKMINSDLTIHLYFIV